jgi:tetratricopeptide (TPR) repeat protein
MFQSGTQRARSSVVHDAAPSFDPLHGAILDDVRALASNGELDRALQLAKQRSAEFIRSGLHDAASGALELAAETLCTLNQPLRSHAFAQEALKTAQVSGNVALQRRARASAARALLRLGEIDKAEAELGQLGPPDHDTDSVALLVRAEVALAMDKIQEARALAERALRGETAGDAVGRARAQLILGICASREHAYKAALRPLTAAVGELQLAPHAETFWQVHAALAGASLKLGRRDHASHYGALAAASAQRVVDALSADLRKPFLCSPTVQAALGAASGRTGWSVVPREMASFCPPSSSS